MSQPNFPPKRCAESCLDYLTLELVRHYKSEQSGPPMPGAIEAIGQRVGAALVERCLFDRPPLTEQLDIMKFICKEFWTEAFRKSIDNLRTNHRGTFVLRDTQFKWLTRLSQNMMPAAMGQPLPPAIPKSDLSKDFLILPCAIVRGALLHLGLDATVTADATHLPQCDFTVVLKQR
jgi:trafficking protein particle complex subunit 6